MVVCELMQMQLLTWMAAEEDGGRGRSKADGVKKQIILLRRNLPLTRASRRQQCGRGSCPG